MFLSGLPFLICSIVFCISQSAAAVEVQTKNHGRYVGVTLSLLQQEQFLGMRYGQSTGGSKRFSKPEPVAKVAPSHVSDASVAGSPCLQPPITGQSFNASEDCLFVNVQRPEGVTEKDRLPVLVHIHGGGFIAGYSTMNGYNGSFLVQKSVNLGEPIIFASFNYRMGLFGFLAGEDMYKQDGKGKAALNAGLYDQRLALTWLRKNIKYFGGDPNKITVMGQSAGALSTSLQMLADGGKMNGLFRGSIQLSGHPSLLPRYDPRTKGRPLAPQDSYEAVLKATGCDSVKCLRRLDSSTIDAANSDLLIQGTLFVPTYDKFFLMQDPHQLLKNTASLPYVPTISAQNVDEGTGLTQYATLQGLGGIARAVGGGLLQEIEKLNPGLKSLYSHDPAKGSPFLPELFGYSPEDTILTGNATSYKRDAAILTDWEFTAGRRETLRAYAKANVPVYSYLFSQPTTILNASLGLWHGNDMSFVFGFKIPGFSSNDTSTPYAKAMATYATQAQLDRATDQMTTIIVSFVNSLNPNTLSANGAVDALMPRWKASNPRMLRFAPGGKTDVVKDDFRDKQVRYIQSQQLKQSVMASI